MRRVRVVNYRTNYFVSRDVRRRDKGLNNGGCGRDGRGKNLVFPKRLNIRITGV